MLSLETIQSIREDYYNGLTHKEFLDKYGISKEVVFAIIYCQQGLTIEQIQARLEQITSGMTSKEIRRVMDGQNGLVIRLSITAEQAENSRQHIIKMFNLDPDTPIAACLEIATEQALKDAGWDVSQIRNITAIVPPAE